MAEDVDVYRPRGESPERGDQLSCPLGVGGADAQRAQAAGVGDGRRQSGRSSARHRRLDNGPLDIEKFGKMCGTVEGHYVLLTWRSASLNHDHSVLLAPTLWAVQRRASESQM